MHNAAKHYVDAFGWALVRLPPKSKGGMGCTPGWERRQEPASTWERYPDHNMGVVLGPSGLVSFDVDDEENTRLIFYSLGLDYDEMLSKCPLSNGSDA